MAVFGVDLFGKSFFGAPLLADYQVADLTATQLGYGHIQVTWSSPPLPDWTQIALVRSGYGFPVSPSDGVMLATWPNTSATSTFDDINLTDGYWYYTIFVSTAFPTWSASATYILGDRVGSDDATWICIASASTNNTPSSSPTFWEASYETQLWNPAGSVASLCVQNLGNSTLLNSLIPPVYHTLPSPVLDTYADNSDLLAFTGILGFGFDMINTELNDLDQPYDVTTVRQDRLYEISDTLGLSAELASSARYQRLRTVMAAGLNQEKGTAQGLLDAIKAATGLDASVATGANLMLSQDQSTFLDPQALPWSATTLYTSGPASEPASLYTGWTTGDQVLYGGVRYTCTAYLYSAGYSTSGITGYPNALSTVVVASTYQNLPGTPDGGGVGVLKETSSSAGPYIDVVFTTYAPGDYVVIVYGVMGPDCGVVTLAVDTVALDFDAITFSLAVIGTPAFTGPPVSSLDTYNAAATSYGWAVQSVPVALSAGSHTVTITAAMKNSAASAYDLQVSLTQVNGFFRTYPPGTPPTGSSGSTQQWTPTIDLGAVTGYLNSMTGGSSTWSPLGSTIGVNVEYQGS